MSTDKVTGTVPGDKGERIPAKQYALKGGKLAVQILTTNAGSVTAKATTRWIRVTDECAATFVPDGAEAETEVAAGQTVEAATPAYRDVVDVFIPAWTDQVQTNKRGGPIRRVKRPARTVRGTVTEVRADVVFVAHDGGGMAEAYRPDQVTVVERWAPQVEPAATCQAQRRRAMTVLA